MAICVGSSSLRPPCKSDAMTASPQSTRMSAVYAGSVLSSASAPRSHPAHVRPSLSGSLTRSSMRRPLMSLAKLGRHAMVAQVYIQARAKSLALYASVSLAVG